MEIKVIASSSSGNAYLVSDGQTRILLDAGLVISKLQGPIGFNISEITACLVSHSHKDHSKSAAELARRGVDVYSSQGTLDACALTGHRFHALAALQEVLIGSFKVLPFDVQHDAPDPLGFLLTSTLTREKLLYFTDTYYLKYRFIGLDIIMAECNYDRESMQKSIDAGYIPIELAPRIIKSHMSLENLIEMLKSNDLHKLKQIYLMHLSSNNSNAELYKKEIQKVTGAEVYICTK